MIKQLFPIIFIFFLISSLAKADSSFYIVPLYNGMALEAKTAIQHVDNAYFLKYVAAEGVVFGGRAYSKEQISDLLSDKHSSLYNHLYSGKTSIKHFFDTVQHPVVKISKRGSNSILISYSSKESNENSSVENCYIRISDNWYLDGIFSCE
jgi:hypothetical protein